MEEDSEERNKKINLDAKVSKVTPISGLNEALGELGGREKYDWNAEPVQSTRPTLSGKKKRESITDKIHQRLRKLRTELPTDGDGLMGTPMIADVEELKKQVRAQLHKEVYSVQDLYKTEGFSQFLATHPMFDGITLMVIMINAIWIWIDTDFNGATVMHESDWPFQVGEHFFAVFFTFEWIIRLSAFRRKLDSLTDPWFLFDTLLLGLMVTETWIMTIIMSLTGITSGGLGDATVLRLVRLLRLARMTRIAKILRAFPEVLIMIKGLTAAGRSVFFTLCLLLLAMYIFGIAFTQLLGNIPDSVLSEVYFGTVPDSMMTLLLQGAFMDDVTDLMHILRQESAIGTGLFILFVLLASITLLNMLVGVLCEVVSMVGQVEREQLLVDFVQSKLKGIVEKMDDDGNGMMSQAEFIAILESQEGLRALDSVGVDPIGLIDLADEIFDSGSIDIDGDDENPQMEFSRFMEEVLQLRGQNTATVKDLTNLRKYIKSEISGQLEELSGQMTAVSNQLKSLVGKVDDVTEQTKKPVVNPDGDQAGGGKGPGGTGGGPSRDSPEQIPQHVPNTFSAGAQREPSPVPLLAQMAAIRRSRPAPKFPREWQDQTTESNGSRASMMASSRSLDIAELNLGFDVQSLERELSQRLGEMQGILDALVRGSGAGSISEMALQTQAEGGDAAAGGQPRVVRVPPNNLKVNHHRIYPHQPQIRFPSAPVPNQQKPDAGQETFSEPQLVGKARAEEDVSRTISEDRMTSSPSGRLPSQEESVEEQVVSSEGGPVKTEMPVAELAVADKPVLPAMTEIEC